MIAPCNNPDGLATFCPALLGADAHPDRRAHQLGHRGEHRPHLPGTAPIGQTRQGHGQRRGLPRDRRRGGRLGRRPLATLPRLSPRLGRRTNRANKKTRRAAGPMVSLGKDLGLGDEAGLEGLDRNPLALDRAVGLEDADALDVRLERALGLLHELEADTAALLGLTAVNDSAALDGALAGDAADTGHGVRAPLESRSKGLPGRLARGK